jgi:hypothetical protein
MKYAFLWQGQGEGELEHTVMSIFKSNFKKVNIY